jgi:hypothetical protein
MWGVLVETGFSERVDRAARLQGAYQAVSNGGREQEYKDMATRAVIPSDRPASWGRFFLRYYYGGAYFSKATKAGQRCCRQLEQICNSTKRTQFIFEDFSVERIYLQGVVLIVEAFFNWVRFPKRTQFLAFGEGVYYLFNPKRALF